MFCRQVANLLLLTTFAALGIRAQSAGTGALTGTVTDPSNATLPGATVSVTNVDTNQSRTTTTGSDGSYKFTLLSPGNYRVSFKAMGFKTAEVPSVTINVTETPVLDRSLEVGAQVEQVLVEAEAGVLQAATSSLGTTIGQNEVAALPLSTRNFTQIVGLSAGVSGGVTNATAIGKATTDYSVNGNDPGQNNYQIDGATANNTANQGSSGDSNLYGGVAIPNPDAIAEFKIQTSTFDASYGRNPGANVNVVTKSGTNMWHGTAWEFFRNEDLNANNFFENRDGGGKQQILRQNQYGGALGGPIKKDKVFIFGDYQGTNQLNGIAAGGFSSFKEPAVPAGDRSTAAWQAAMGAANCHNPTFYAGFGVPQEQVACNGSNINSVALGMLNLKLPDGSYYMPTNTGPGGLQVALSNPASYTQHQLVTNLDYLINSKNTLSGRFFYSQDPQVQPLAGTLPGTPNTLYYANTNAVLKLTTLVSGTIVNEARVSGQRNNSSVSAAGIGSPVGVGLTPIIPNYPQLPNMIFFDGTFGLGGAGFQPLVSPTNQMQLADQISWSHGKHTIRAGYEFEGSRWPLSFLGLSKGFLEYGTFSDFLVGKGACNSFPTDCSNPNNNGSPFGNLYATNYSYLAGPSGLVHNYGEHNMNAFVQDDFKISSRLTLNIGVRWEFDGVYNDKYGSLTDVWPSLLLSTTPPTSAPAAGTAGPASGYVGYVVPNNFLAHYPQPPAGVTINSNGRPILGRIPLSNFAPRLGFAWQPGKSNHLVVRAGAGIFYDRIGGDRFVHAAEAGDPYSQIEAYTSSNTQTDQNPFPLLSLGWSPRWFNPATGASSLLQNTGLYPVLHTPLVRQYNVGIQYEFAPRWVLELGYVGSSGINLVDPYHMYNEAQLASPSSPVNGQTTNTLQNVNARVPYVGYASIGLPVTAYDGSSRYDSLQITVRKQYSYGLTLQGSYTWGKDLADIAATTGNTGGANINDANNLSAQRGPASFSRPQRFILNYAYNLPFGMHKGVAGKLLEGWNLSGVTTVQGGTRLTITDSRAGTIYGLNGGQNVVETAQMCPSATYSSALTSGGIESRLGGKSSGGYFNTSGFCAPPVIGNGTGYGNSGVGILPGPGQFNFDVSLIKNTRIKESQTIQLRAEFFNLLNHAQFSNPATAFSSPATFGQITTTSVSSRIVQLALKYAF